MFLRRFYDDGLAQASWMIGCQKTGDAIVIDANRDIRQYLEVAAAEKLHITQVTETHIHADYVSGARELARATGATLLLSAEGGPDWQYAFAAADGARLLRDGDRITIGNIHIAVMHTPGHTPEHLSFLVTDTAAASEPIGIVTGDFVFVGDVGRPDLLEKAAKVANTMEAGARQLFHSLERFRALPDFVQVWPGHGAGSACGKALGAIPTSTVGYEKRFNWGVATTDEGTFVRMVLEGQPEPPLYFAEMKRINREGPTILGGFPEPLAGDRDALERALAAGSVVIDTRPAAVFAAGHVPGTLNIPLNKSFSTWAGWLVRYDVDIALIADNAAAVATAVRELAMIGLDRVGSWYPSAVVTAWQDAGRRLGTIATLEPATLAPRLSAETVTLIDVRNQSEWAAGHLPHARHIPLGYLTERLAEIPRDRPIVVQCQGGARSAIAAAHLQRLGLSDVHDLLGGFQRWASEGHEVVR
ncbi:MAG: MBL fold metallo-hydrolase [Gemmatimonadota bacterium]|nr:MBL fold metallo-hydrolase [Gemmatimonadota bacterium]MDQ8147895.1 MBL fold metallo-hydrolase [Gemmatimonadota bacterium]MDQ8149783.1 MBL fold metallo-hydrolase [Gemmatimonadota bacterium]MDQ8157458.1 MBL fold metallo-hydrolase [Gemmatimonadota bacterium]MDQ8177209.1 MBL fold metallo-hydrolase [Gemmatimonadota bacterium]